MDAVRDDVQRFPRRRVVWRYQGIALGSALIVIPLLQMRRGDVGDGGWWFVLLGVLLVAASAERGPDEVALERHAVVVRGGGGRRRAWVTRFERGEVADLRVRGLWLHVDRTDGERVRYWIRSQDRHALAAALDRWRTAGSR